MEHVRVEYSRHLTGDSRLHVNNHHPVVLIVAAAVRLGVALPAGWALQRHATRRLQMGLLAVAALLFFFSSSDLLDDEGV